LQSGDALAAEPLETTLDAMSALIAFQACRLSLVPGGTLVVPNLALLKIGEVGGGHAFQGHPGQHALRQPAADALAARPASAGRRLRGVLA